MEAYLREVIQSADFYTYLEQAEDLCMTQYDGSLHHKWNCICVNCRFLLMFFKLSI